jgi:hypothetical protein
MQVHLARMIPDRKTGDRRVTKYSGTGLVAAACTLFFAE